MIKKILK